MNDKTPIVSIITPTFNHERYIGECLRSALAQTETRWEQIVIDDGSNDGTGAIVQALEDPRIRYVRRDHKGIMYLAEAYNLALSMAHGEFVAVLEGDDSWPADKLERQLPMFASPAVVLAWGVAEITDEFGLPLRTLPRPRIVRRAQGLDKGQTLKALLVNNFIPACTVMCRRSTLLAVGGFQQPATIPTTDYPTWLELCRAGNFAATTDVLGIHRKHREQVTVQMKPAMNLALDWGSRFVEKLPARERAALNITVGAAHVIRRHRHGYLDYEGGRAALRAGSGEVARSLFRRAIRGGATATRLKALLGLGCCYLGLDFERVARSANRVFGR